VPLLPQILGPKLSAQLKLSFGQSTRVDRSAEFYIRHKMSFDSHFVGKIAFKPRDRFAPIRVEELSFRLLFFIHVFIRAFTLYSCLLHFRRVNFRFLVLPYAPCLLLSRHVNGEFLVFPHAKMGKMDKRRQIWI